MIELITSARRFALLTTLVACAGGAPSSRVAPPATSAPAPPASAVDNADAAAPPASPRKEVVLVACGPIAGVTELDLAHDETGALAWPVKGAHGTLEVILRPPADGAMSVQVIGAPGDSGSDREAFAWIHHSAVRWSVPHPFAGARHVRATTRCDRSLELRFEGAMATGAAGSAVITLKAPSPDHTGILELTHAEGAQVPIAAQGEYRDVQGWHPLEAP